MSRQPFSTLLCWIVFAVPAYAQQGATDAESWLRLHYEKREVKISVRDGTKLHTTIYSPRDTTKTYPMLMKRTPYGCKPYGANDFPTMLGPSSDFANEGFIFVYQDVRGRFLSEGQFEHVTPHRTEKKSKTDVDESSDTHDTIDWLLKNVKNHNGRVGMWGISYPGFYVSAGMIDAHPALVACSPQAPVGDWYFDDFLHNGAFYLVHAFRWLSANSGKREGPTTNQFSPFEFPTKDGYKFFLDMGPIKNANAMYLKDQVEFWKVFSDHPTRDEFWKKREIMPHLKKVAPHVMVVTGWYDAEDLYGSFSTYRAIEKQNPGVDNVLVVGPWYHGGWERSEGDHLGAVAFGSKTGEFYRKHIELPFFLKHLKDAQLPALPEATVFETGGNHWRIFDAWPPEQSVPTTYFAAGDGKLTTKATVGKGDAFVEFLSDPQRPVPYIENMSPTMTREHMIDDQRFASHRPDVAVFQSDVLDEDVTLAGRLQADLWVSTSAGDADWIVKLIDVFPDNHPDNAFTPAHQSMGGYQKLVRSEVIRGRFRESFEHPKPFVANEPTKVPLTLQDVLHRFKKGHRIMFQVQSTWFPLVDRNPQKYVENIFAAEAEDYIKATHRIFTGPDHPTQFKVFMVPDVKTAAE